MIEEAIEKSLIIQQDIEYGEGVITQNRNGTEYIVDKVRTIYPINSTGELATLDGTKYPKVALFENDSLNFYSYKVDSYHLVSSSSGGEVQNGYVVEPIEFPAVYDADTLETLFLLKSDINQNRVFTLSSSNLTKSLKLEKYAGEAGEIIFNGNIRIDNSSVVTISELYLKDITVKTPVFLDSANTDSTISNIYVENCKIANNDPSQEVFILGYTLNNCHIINTEFINPDFTSLGLNTPDNPAFLDNCFYQGTIVFPTYAANGSTLTNVTTGVSYICNNNNWVEVFSNNLKSSEIKVSANTYQILAGLIAKSRQTKIVESVEVGYLNVDNYSKIILDSDIPLAISRIENDSYIDEIIIYTRQDDVIITANDQIKTKDNLNKTLNAEDLIRFVKFDGKWHEV